MQRPYNKDNYLGFFEAPEKDKSKRIYPKRKTKREVEQIRRDKIEAKK